MIVFLGDLVGLLIAGAGAISHCCLILGLFSYSRVVLSSFDMTKCANLIVSCYVVF